MLPLPRALGPLIPIWALAVLLSAGCATGELSADLEDSQLAASWRYEPLSWEKLDAIETWLDQPQAWADPGLRTEALLQLAEGRLSFARSERVGLAPGVLAGRVARSEQGFRAVLAQPAASVAQRNRARAGLASAGALVGTGVGASGLPPIVAREQWGAASAIPPRMTPWSGPWTRITVHHSAELGGGVRGSSLGDSSAQLRRMQSYHMTAPDHRWGDLGYHFLIDPSGRVFEGRELVWQGAHARGSNNERNIGVCLMGNFDREAVPPAALASLEALIDGLRTRYSISRAEVHGHSDFVVTQCPGARLMPWVERYRR